MVVFATVDAILPTVADVPPETATEVNEPPHCAKISVKLSSTSRYLSAITSSTTLFARAISA